MKAKRYGMQIGCLGLILAACGGPDPSSNLQEAPDARNHPNLMGVLLKQLDTMVPEARLDTNTTPWSNYYWATFKGGISYRWQTMRGSHYRQFIYNFETKPSVMQLSQAQLDQLSPAEKYDLARGDYSFSIANRERANMLASVRRDNIPYWFGYCHGSAPASILEREPGAKASVVNPDGLTVNFFQADMKALFAKQYGDARVGVRAIGGRCYDQVIAYDARNRIISPECRDVNPASLHVVVEEYIAQRRQSFIADLFANDQVWNYPIVGYKFTVANRRPFTAEGDYAHAAEGTAELADVDLTLYYTNGGEPTLTMTRTWVSTNRFRYTLELDSNGVVIGGEWLSAERPDFLWEMVRIPSQANDGPLDYNFLDQLRNSSLAAAPTPAT